MTYNPNADPPWPDDKPACPHCNEEFGCIACFATGRTGMDGELCPECEGSGTCPWCGHAGIHTGPVDTEPEGES